MSPPTLPRNGQPKLSWSTFKANKRKLKSSNSSIELSECDRIDSNCSQSDLNNCKSIKINGDEMFLLDNTSSRDTKATSLSNDLLVAAATKRSHRSIQVKRRSRTTLLPRDYTFILASLLLVLNCCDQMNLITLHSQAQQLEAFYSSTTNNNSTATDSKSDYQQQVNQKLSLGQQQQHLQQTTASVSHHQANSSINRLPPLFAKLQQQQVPQPLHLRLGNQKREHPNTSQACEGSRMDLNCGDSKMIHIVRANYGRFSLSICNEHGYSNYSVKCFSFRAFLIMETRCNKLSNCSVTVSEELFGDPCEGTAKYLEVQYYCYDVDSPNNQHQQSRPATSGTSSTTTSPNQVISNSNGGIQTASATGGSKSAPAAPSSSHKSQATANSQQQQQQQQVGEQTSMDNHHQGRTTGMNQNEEISSSVGQDDLLQQQPAMINVRNCAAQFGARNLFWNSTRAGQMARQSCPEGSRGFVTWTCDSSSLRFVPIQSANFTQCQTLWLLRLAQQLERLLELPLVPKHGGSLEMVKQQNEQTIRSILNELVLVTGKKLFSHDLLRLDIMLGQMLAQVRSLGVLVGGAIQQQQDSPRQLASSSLAQLHEEFHRKLVEITSQLFDWSQRHAWLELTDSHERQRVEMRLLAHLRDSGQLWANSIQAINNRNFEQQQQPIIKHTNVVSSITVIQQLLNLDLISGGSSNELSVFPIRTSNNIKPNSFMDTNEQSLELSDLRLATSLVRELSALGVSKFLVLDIKKPDFNLLARQQVVEQQQQQSLWQQTNDARLGVAGAGSTLAWPPLDMAPQAAQQPNDQTRIFGVFALIGGSSETFPSLSSIDALLGNEESQQQQAAVPANDKLREARKLAREFLAQWPISVEFKQQVASVSQDEMFLPPLCQALGGAQTTDPQIEQPTMGSCRLSKYDASHSVCSCDRFGFVALQQQQQSSSSSSQFKPSLNDQSWTDSLEANSNQPATKIDSNDPFQSSTYLTTVGRANSNSSSPGLLMMSFIVVGCGLLMLVVGASFVQLAGRLWANHRAKQASHLKQKSFFDSFGGASSSSAGGPTTGPLTADLMLGGGHQHSSSIIGLNGAQHLHQNQFNYQPAGNKQIYGAGQSMGFPSSASSSSHSPPIIEAYAPMMSSSQYHHMHPSSHRHQDSGLHSQVGHLTRWLVAKPFRWLAAAISGNHGTNGGHPNNFVAGASGKSADGLQHRVVLGANGVSSALIVPSDANTTNSSLYKCHNGYTTNLGRHQQQQHLNRQQQHQQAQQNSSSSSYVSSSAYYEEIGQAAANHNNKSSAQMQNNAHTLVDPFGSRRRQQQVPNGTTGIAYSMELPPQPHQANSYGPVSMLSSTNGKQTDLTTTSTAQTTPRHYLFASPSAVNAYKQQQQHFRGHHQNHGQA